MASPITSKFIDILRYGSFLIEGKCTVYNRGKPTQWLAPFSTVNLTVTRNATYRTQGTITAQILPTIPPTPVLPLSPSSVLAPFGTEIFVQTAIASTSLPTTQKWTSLGLLDIATTTVDDTTIDLTVALQVYDRSWVMGQRLFKSPYKVPAVTGNFVAEIKALVNSVWGTTPKINFVIAPTALRVPSATFNQGTSPWTAVLRMATAVGYEIFFNSTGDLVGYPTPTPRYTEPVWNFTETPTAVYGSGTGSGSTALLTTPYSTPTGAKVQMTRDGVFNDVLVTGAGTSQAPGATTTTGTTTVSTNPVLGEAKTTNPQSPTYVTGPMGDVPEFVSTPLVTTPTQAKTSAQNYLTEALSDAWQVSITCAPNPIFQIDDVVTVTRARLGLTNTKIVIDSITHVIGYATLMTLTGRVIPT